MKNKIITAIFSLVFIIVFSIFNIEEYKNFHLEKTSLEDANNINNQKLKEFSLSDIKYLEDVEFYNTPNKNLLEKIANSIKEAKEEIYLETYMLTENRTKEALIKAHKNWVKIKVILEKDPYMSYNINNKAYTELQKAWIDVVWSDKKNYTFNHTKVLIIDDLSIISTWNYSYSTFTQNRDLFIFTFDKNIKEKLKQNFLNDYNYIKINIFDENLVFSPNYSRVIFEKMFNEAENNIKMYFQYLYDDDLIKKLIEIKKEKKIDIEIVIAKTASDDKEIKYLKENDIKITALEKNKMHSKAILIDEKYLFIWSINFSTNSLNNNREVWILLKNEEIIKDFLYLFKQDIKNKF